MTSTMPPPYWNFGILVTDRSHYKDSILRNRGIEHEFTVKINSNTVCCALDNDCRANYRLT